MDCTFINSFVIYIYSVFLLSLFKKYGSFMPTDMARNANENLLGLVTPSKGVLVHYVPLYYTLHIIKFIVTDLNEKHVNNNFSVESKTSN